MFKRFRQLCLATAFAVGSAGASAAPITGSISPGDGFDPALGLGLSIVSQLNAIGIGSPSTCNQPGCATGDLIGALTFAFGSTYTLNSFSFDLADPDGPGNTGTLIFSGNGFNFYLTSVDNIVRTPLSCTGAGLCKDALGFDWDGFITGPVGFDPTSFTGNWTGQGGCQGSVVGGCTASVSASWSASIVSTGTLQVPEPATLALLGIGLLGIGVARRRKH